MSKIEWTNKTWNPVRGCTKISPGCKNCYAETFAERWRGIPGHPYEQGFDLRLVPEKLDEPLKWIKPQKIFVNSMSDLFHEGVPWEYVDQVFAVMALCPHHTFQILTKRPERMYEYLSRRPEYLIEHWSRQAVRITQVPCADFAVEERPFPLPNVWLGVTTENQEYADKRIPLLLQTPAAVRFLSCEPLLEPVNLVGNGYGPNWLEGWEVAPEHDPSCNGYCDRCPIPVQVRINKIDWVIAGGESGHGARPMHPDWVRSLRDQCQQAGIPFFFKQWGEWVVSTHIKPGMPQNTLAWPWDKTGDTTCVFKVGKKNAGRELDGRTWDQFPEVVHVTS